MEQNDTLKASGIDTLRSARKVYDQYPKQIQKLREGFLEGDAEKFSEALEDIKSTHAKLNAVISQFPATKEFLASKNLADVSELDETGKRELEEYLQKVLDVLRS